MRNIKEVMENAYKRKVIKKLKIIEYDSDDINKILEKERLDLDELRKYGKLLKHPIKRYKGWKLENL